MIPTETQYLYCMNDVCEEDFVTTSFSYFSDVINIFNFNQEDFDMCRTKYVAIDYTLDPFTSFHNNNTLPQYTNSNALQVFRVKFVEQDIDRMTVTLLIIESIKSFDLKNYKRDIKIENIINE